MDHLAPSSGVNWYNYSPFGELLGGSQLPPMEFAGLEVGRQLTPQMHYASASQVAVNSGIHYVQDTRNINLVEEVHVTQQDLLLPPAEPKATNRIRPALGEKISCLECGATFACGANLRNHLRIHTGERPYVCEECGASFTQRSNLRSHKRVHTGERPYMCGICGQTFARSSHLPGHMRTHTGEKPFNCPHCGRSFATNQIMKNHMRTHTGERPFVCDVCDATFAQSSCLATHKKIHTGERNFKCGECGKAFISRSGLQTHERVHTGEKPYTCEKCDKSFKTSSYLSKHKQKYCGNNGYKNRVERPDMKKPDRKTTTVRKMGKSVKAVKSAARLPKRCVSKRLRRSRRHRGTESDEELIDGLAAMTNTDKDLSSTDTESMGVKREKIDARDSISELIDMNSVGPQECRYQENQDPLEVHHFKDEKYHVGATSLVDLHQEIKHIDSEQYQISDYSTQIHQSEPNVNVEEHVSDVLSEEFRDASQSTGSSEEQVRSTSQVLLEAVPVQITEQQNPQHSHTSRNGEITWYSNDCLSYYCSRM